MRHCQAARTARYQTSPLRSKTKTSTAPPQWRDRRRRTGLRRPRLRHEGLPRRRLTGSPHRSSPPPPKARGRDSRYQPARQRPPLSLRRSTPRGRAPCRQLGAGQDGAGGVGASLRYLDRETATASRPYVSALAGRDGEVHPIAVVPGSESGRSRASGDRHAGLRTIQFRFVISSWGMSPRCRSMTPRLSRTKLSPDCAIEAAEDPATGISRWLDVARTIDRPASSSWSGGGLDAEPGLDHPPPCERRPSGSVDLGGRSINVVRPQAHATSSGMGQPSPGRL